jgi:hypothetical protein
MNLYHLFLGWALIVWYAAIRWTLFSDASKYPWAYSPINLTTAFLSIVFLFTTTTLPNLNAQWLSVLAYFLAFRNVYYSAEDFLDLHINVPQQLFFIGIDVAMVIYCFLYLLNR